MSSLALYRDRLRFCCHCPESTLHFISPLSLVMYWIRIWIEIIIWTRKRLPYVPWNGQELCNFEFKVDLEGGGRKIWMIWHL